MSFPSVFDMDTSFNPKNISWIPDHLNATFLIVQIDINVSGANINAVASVHFRARWGRDHFARKLVL